MCEAKTTIRPSWFCTKWVPKRLQTNLRSLVSTGEPAHHVVGARPWDQGCNPFSIYKDLSISPWWPESKKEGDLGRLGRLEQGTLGNGNTRREEEQGFLCTWISASNTYLSRLAHYLNQKERFFSVPQCILPSGCCCAHSTCAAPLGAVQRDSLA